MPLANIRKGHKLLGYLNTFQMGQWFGNIGMGTKVDALAFFYRIDGGGIYDYGYIIEAAILFQFWQGLCSVQ